jgi:hypothetical protein
MHGNNEANILLLFLLILFLKSQPTVIQKKSRKKNYLHITLQPFNDVRTIVKKKNLSNIIATFKKFNLN